MGGVNNNVSTPRAAPKQVDSNSTTVAKPQTDEAAAAPNKGWAAKHGTGRRAHAAPPSAAPAAAAAAPAPDLKNPGVVYGQLRSNLDGLETQLKGLAPP